MSPDYKEMDSWTSEEISEFKEAGFRRARTGAATFMAKGPQDLIAEGDSWFHYLPGTDILDCLRNHYGYEIDSYAKAGDTLENMIYGTELNSRFHRPSPQIRKVLNRIGLLKPKVFLFSGGGNDVAGDEFESYLNHKESGLPAFRDAYFDNMVNVVFRKYYEDLIEKVAAVSPKTYIVTHGYGRTLPTGEGVDILFITFMGPWLLPALAKKGIDGETERREISFKVIDGFNAMLKDLADRYDRFQYVDLRDMIDPVSDWANELHLKNSAYARVSERIHGLIQALT